MDVWCGEASSEGPGPRAWGLIWPDIWLMKSGFVFKINFLTTSNYSVPGYPYWEMYDGNSSGRKERKAFFPLLPTLPLPVSLYSILQETWDSLAPRGSLVAFVFESLALLRFRKGWFKMQRHEDFLEGENCGQRGEEYLRGRDMDPAPRQCPTEAWQWMGDGCHMPPEAED